MLFAIDLRKLICSFEPYYSSDAMNPATNNSHHEPTKDDCELCGFMKPDSGEDEENTD